MKGVGIVGRATFCALALAAGSAGGAASPPARERARPLETGCVAMTVSAGPYEFTPGNAGERIEMAGFGRISDPGRPDLPLKRFVISLPPGAKARSVEVVRTRTSALQGRHTVEPFPPLPPPPSAGGSGEIEEGAESEWQGRRNSSYGSDAPFPETVAWLSNSGTLREIPYASVAFCPFTYYPRSGMLDLHREVDLLIHYELPEERVLGAVRGGALATDPAAEARAARLFANYGNPAPPYRSEGSPPESQACSYRYVIITSGSLLGAVRASSFMDWKASLGYRIRTVLTEDAEIACQPGRDLAEKIRNFLRAYYAPWGIEYVLLVGDYATVPMRICYPNPAYHVYDPGDPGLVAPGTPTDYYYADLSLPDSQSWDADGDGYYGEFGEDEPDFLAEVAVGRIPVNDGTRITYALDKIVDTERDTGAWKGAVLQGGAILFFANQNHSGYPFIDGATCLDIMETELLSGRAVTHYSERTGIVRSLFAWPAISEATFTDAWGAGAFGIVNWSGHGWPDGVYRTIWQWDDGDGVPETSNGEMVSRRLLGHGSAYLSDERPSVLFAVSCDVGYPEPNPYGNLGIDLLTLPGWGPVAGIVSASRPASISADFSTYRGGSESICYEFNRYVAVEEEPIGIALYDGKFFATTHYGWNYLYEYMNLYDFNLYGDPSLVVVGATPRTEVTLLATKGDGTLADFEWLGGAEPTWTLQRSGHPAFAEPEVVYWGADRNASDKDAPSPVLFYRVAGVGED